MANKSSYLNNNQTAGYESVNYDDLKKWDGDKDEVVNLEELEKEHKGSTQKLLNQIAQEHDIALRKRIEKIRRNLERLKLYNNQKKDDDIVADVSLFTVMQTLMASFYDDEMSVDFAGFEEGDEDVAENIQQMARYDYNRMGKKILEYFWNFDTMFTGRGLMYMLEFDDSKYMKCPKPNIIDSLTFLPDPNANSVNGYNKFQSRPMTFGGHEITFQMYQINGKPGYYNLSGLKPGRTALSLYGEVQQSRDQALGLQSDIKNDFADLGVNALFYGLRWFTHWHDPRDNKVKKVIAVSAQDNQKLIKLIVLGNDYWPIIDRPMYPTSQTWDGVSVPDLVEDKQRHRSVVMNLSLQSMKSDLYPMMLFSEDRIKNKQELLSYQWNKYVGVKGDGDIRGAVQPMNKANPNYQLADWIMNTMDASAQVATATPEMQQGQIANQERTLGELNLVAARVDTRYSLTVKVFGWSEHEFWRQYYNLIKKNFKKGSQDEKLMRLVGVTGYEYRKIMPEDVWVDYDPDIIIESKQVSDAREARERILLQNYTTLVINASLRNPKIRPNETYLMRELGKLNGLNKDQLNYALPMSAQELQAKAENESLSNGEFVPVSPNDDHMLHILINDKAAETPQKQAHIMAHLMAARMIQENPELAPQNALPQGQQATPVQTPIPNVDQSVNIQ